MSALLASSFVGRVAAFKATKIQVRIFLAFERRAETRGRGARRRGDAGRDGTRAMGWDRARRGAATRDARAARRRRWDGANARREMI